MGLPQCGISTWLMTAVDSDSDMNAKSGRAARLTLN